MNGAIKVGADFAPVVRSMVDAVTFFLLYEFGSLLHTYVVGILGVCKWMKIRDFIAVVSGAHHYISLCVESSAS